MTMTSFGAQQQQQLTQGDVQQLWNTSQQTFEEMRTKITEASKVIVRYCQLARPVANPAELLMIADQALQASALAIIDRVEPNSGRIRPRHYQQNQQRAQRQRAQQQVALPPALAGLSAGQNGLNRAQRRQIQQLTRQTVLQLTGAGVSSGMGSAID